MICLVIWGWIMEKREFKIEIRSSFYLVCFAACLMHLTFLATFACFHLYLMVTLNIVSVTLYIVSGVYTMRHDITGHALGWIIAMFTEILLHAVIVTLIQGLEVFFFLYPLMAFPIYGYYLFVYCDKDTFVKSSVAFGMITMFALIVLITWIEMEGTVYDITSMHVLTRTEIIVLRSVNILFTLIMIVACVLIFFIEIIDLVEKLRVTNDKLNFAATHDALTGLNNRHSLWKFFEELIKSGDSYCVVMGDLDDFKKINDTFGHDCGDLVLKSVAAIIIDNTGENDMACRWGGEEMLIVMRGSREDCFARISVIKSEISSLDIKSDGRPVKVTMTFGFADSEEEGAALAARSIAENSADSDEPAKIPAHLGIDSLISMVDKRLYIGKRSGKNVIICAAE